MADMSKYVQKCEDGLIVIYLINKASSESINGKLCIPFISTLHAG